MPKRQSKGEILDISFAQKNKWNNDGMQYLFYVKTGGMASTDSEGKKHTRYPLASVMTLMKPSTQGTAGPEVIEGCKACDKAFALACCYSGGRDLVEEMVASKCWPLGPNRPAMWIKMVSLPVFGDGVGVLFPCFDVRRVEDMTADEYVTSIEEGARDILGELSDKEYLARRAIGGHDAPSQLCL
jgi:hypothetical protein